MVEKVEEILSTLAASYISLSGRITLIWSTLSIIRFIFFLFSNVQLPLQLGLEKLQREFLWHGSSTKTKFDRLGFRHLVCKPKKDRGLGIRPVRLLNQALLGKWLRRVGSNAEGLWRQLIVAKYSINREGWDIQNGAYKYLAIWRGICSVKEKFMQNTKFRLGSCTKLFFWLDTWVGENPLKLKYPELFNCAMDRRVNSVITWSIQAIIQSGALRSEGMCRIMKKDGFYLFLITLAPPPSIMMLRRRMQSWNETG